MSVKMLQALCRVRTPDGIGTLLGRDKSEEVDVIVVDGEPRTLVAVQFCDKQMRGGVRFYDINLVERLDEAA